MSYTVKVSANKSVKKITQLTCYAFVSYLFIVPIVSAKEAQLATKILTCSEITGNQSRLDCFDALTSNNNLVVGTAKPVAINNASLKAEQQVDDFAKEHVKKSTQELEKEVDSISVTVSKLSKTVRGQWQITFENGQKWQQKDSGTLSLKQGDEVILTKGAFSSVFLQKEDTNRRIKVKRLK